ncbi:Hint domain-containing protein, partial [Paracoccus aerius]
ASTVVFNGGTGTFANGGSTASFNTIEAVTTGAGADSIDASLNTVAGAVFTTGAGSDTITGGSAAETINAGADGDVIDGGAGADTIDAGLGDDRIALGASHGNDTITGGEGADTLSGGGLAGAQPATVTFSNGAGTFASSGGTASFNTIETIETGAGADSINAAANTGGASFVTGAGNDSFVGGLGAETVSGGDGDDTLLTGGGNDSVVAGDGNDSVEAGDGADYVDGGSGADTVDGGAGNDTLLGGADNDLLRGGAGDDSLLGGAGNDILLGGDGDDFLDGGPGANTLTGGAGSDTFIVSSGDIITDFSSGNAGSGTDGDPTNNDRLDLSRFYNQANLDIINAQRGANGLQPYRSVLGWLKADQEDDGVLNSLRTANGLPENFTLTIQNGGTAVSAAALTDETTGVVCFGADAMIETADGPVPAGSLKVGDLVLTRDDGYQPIRWVGHRTLTASDLAANPAFRPIRIRQGALGGGLPDADLIVSPQHRVLARSKIAERMFGTREVLVAAKQLVVTEGIDIAEDLATVTYVHFLFDAHQIVISNGAETESLYTGDEALKSIPAEARAEILGLFPELAEDAVRPAARKMLSGRMARKLAQRHAQNGKKLVA